MINVFQKSQLAYSTTTAKYFNTGEIIWSRTIHPVGFLLSRLGKGFKKCQFLEGPSSTPPIDTTKCPVVLHQHNGPMRHNAGQILHPGHAQLIAIFVAPHAYFFGIRNWEQNPLGHKACSWPEFDWGKI